jgi:N-acetylmuramoyl-L-alanine amidase
MLPITQDLLTSKKNRPALRNSFYKIKKLKGIVIHWTANPHKGAGAKANRNYFNLGERYASAHYCVDDSKIIQCIPDDEVGYHVGANSYKPQGIKLMENNLTPNYFLIGIEMCINVDSNWSKTYQNTIELTQYLLKKHHFTVNDIYRHYDITGKDCPKMMINESQWTQYKADMKKSLNLALDIPFNTWERFKADINDGLEFKTAQIIKKGYVNTTDLNVRKGNGTQFDIVAKLKQGDKIDILEEIGNWYKIGDNQWVNKLYIVITFTKQDAIIIVKEANVRSGPGTNNGVVDKLLEDDLVEVIDQYNGWNQIGPNRWIHNTLMKIVTVRSGRVTVPDFLNVRKGPGTNFSKISQLNTGELVKIFEEENGWFRISEDGWAFANFITLID